MRATLLVTAMLVLAGCSGVASTGDQAAVTPAPVPTAEPQSPPGVSEHRVAPRALSSAHAGSLASRNYSVRTTQQIRTADGEVIRRTVHTRTVSVRAAAFVGSFDRDTDTFRSGDTSARVDYWSNSSVVYTRYQTGSATSEASVHRWQDRDAVPLTDLTGAQYLRGVLAGTDVSPSRRLADGDVVLTADSLVDRSPFVVPLILSEPRNVSGRLRVRTDGIVTRASVVGSWAASRIGQSRASVAYDATHNGVPVRLQRTTVVSVLGTAAVETPGWVTNASFEDDAGVDTAGHSDYW